MGYTRDGIGHRAPDTSREAAESMAIHAPGLRGTVLRALQNGGPMTADECANKLGMSVLSIRPRFTELLAAGLIEDTGQRRQNTSGRNAMVFRAKAP